MQHDFPGLASAGMVAEYPSLSGPKFRPVSADGPDLDKLFGEEEDEARDDAGAARDSGTVRSQQQPQATAPLRPHPALVHAVSEAATGWQEMAKQLRAQPGASEFADHLQAAIEGLASQDWSTCRDAACTCRKTCWMWLHEHSGWPGSVTCRTLSLAELLLALCCAASGDAAGALSHADGALLVPRLSPAFRRAAFLFATVLNDEVALSWPPPVGPLSSAQFAEAPESIQRPVSPFATSEVVRVQTPSVDEVRDLVRSANPFVIEGALEGWAASERWRSLAYFDRVAGYRLVPVELGTTERRDSNDPPEPMRLADFLRDCLASDCLRCAGGDDADSTTDIAGNGFGHCIALENSLLEQCAGLRGDVPAVPPLWRSALGRPSHSVAWLGAGGALTPCRWDGRETFLAQIQGTCRVVLMPPEASPQLKARGEGTPRRCVAGARDRGRSEALSVHDIESQDAWTHLPKLADVEGAEAVELAPGDALFVPQGWWHQVRALGPACLVSFYY